MNSFSWLPLYLGEKYHCFIRSLLSISLNRTSFLTFLVNVYSWLKLPGSLWRIMADRFPSEDASRSSQPLRGPYSEPRSQRQAPRQYPASLDTDLSLITELRRSEEEASGHRSLPNNLVKFYYVNFKNIFFFFWNYRSCCVYIYVCVCVCVCKKSCEYWCTSGVLLVFTWWFFHSTVPLLNWDSAKSLPVLHTMWEIHMQVKPADLGYFFIHTQSSNG